MSDRDTSSLRPAPGRSLTSYRCDFAWLGTSTEVERDVLIDVDGERIIRVAAASADRQAADEALALHGLTIPGMANCHSHAFHRAIRGRTQRGAGSFWTWREAMYDDGGDARSRQLPRPRNGDVRRDGARRDHGSRRVPLPPPPA
ncbi:MAG: hypothetical protein WKF58_08195 [Ilumatobacteraceae bacterium]